MKKPNYGQQQKMNKLASDPVALTAYCKEKGFEVPQMSVPTSPLSQNPKPPDKTFTIFGAPPISSVAGNLPTIPPAPPATNDEPIASVMGGYSPLNPDEKHRVVVTPVSDHEVELPKEGETTTSSVVESVVTTVVEEQKPEPKKEPRPIEVVARIFFALHSRLEQNAAHSVLNWDEMADLEAMLKPFYKPNDDGSVPVPKEAALPAGQRWAVIVGEPMNRTQKLIRFTDEDRHAPHKLLFVPYSVARQMGRRVRVIQNPNENQGGYILAG